MTDFKKYGPTDLAEFTGRPAASFPTNFIEKSAYPQALLLFKLATCRSTADGLNATELEMVDFAIMGLMDAIHLVQPYQTVRYSPFNSESIGSYSYSRAASAIALGQTTGVDWFDTAVQLLSLCALDSDIPMSSGIDVFGRGFGVPQTGPGITTVLTDAELALSRTFGHDPSAASIG